MKNWYIGALVLAAAFIGGWLLGQRASRPEVVETVRVDTVFFEKPQPVSIADIPVTVNVPRLIFATKSPEAVNITNQVTNQATNQEWDSVEMRITLRTLEYRDSTYYARVVGPVVGELAPRLDFIETYNTTITRTATIDGRRRFGLDVVAGTEYARVGWTPFAELAFSVDLRFASISATVGADNIFRDPIPRVGLSASVPLWSRGAAHQR